MRGHHRHPQHLNTHTTPLCSLYMDSEAAKAYGVIDKVVDKAMSEMGDDRIRAEDISTLSRGLG
eukprot:4065173-Prymnesium_polylepis.2